MKRIELEHLIIYMRLQYEGNAKINSDTIQEEFDTTEIDTFTVSEELFNENIDDVRKLILGDVDIYALIE